MMELNPTPVTLVCGMGSHASSVFLYMRQYNVRKIYIVYSKVNTSEYDVKIKEIITQINKEINDLDHKVIVYHVKIDERDFEDSFITVSRIYEDCKKTTIITDLTAGHKIISYILFYVHSYSSHKIERDHKIVYIYNKPGKDRQILLPPIDVDRLKPRVDNMLVDMDNYVKLKNIGGVSTSLVNWLFEGNGTKGSYTEPTIYRYKRELRDKGFVDIDSDSITVKGMMYLCTI